MDHLSQSNDARIVDIESESSINMVLGESVTPRGGLAGAFGSCLLCNDNIKLGTFEAVIKGAGGGG